MSHFEQAPSASAKPATASNARLRDRSGRHYRLQRPQALTPTRHAPSITNVDPQYGLLAARPRPMRERIRAGFPLCYAGRGLARSPKIKPGEGNTMEIRPSGSAASRRAPCRLFHRQRLAGSNCRDTVAGQRAREPRSFSSPAARTTGTPIRPARRSVFSPASAGCRVSAGRSATCAPATSSGCAERETLARRRAAEDHGACRHHRSARRQIRRMAGKGDDQQYQAAAGKMLITMDEASTRRSTPLSPTGRGWGEGLGVAILGAEPPRPAAVRPTSPARGEVIIQPACAHLAALAPFFRGAWTGRAGHGKLPVRFTATTGFTNAGA